MKVHRDTGEGLTLVDITEIQPRRMYEHLRQWLGDEDPSEPEETEYHERERLLAKAVVKKLRMGGGRPIEDDGHRMVYAALKRRSAVARDLLALGEDLDLAWKLFYRLGSNDLIPWRCVAGCDGISTQQRARCRPCRAYQLMRKVIDELEAVLALPLSGGGMAGGEAP